MVLLQSLLISCVGTLALSWGLVKMFGNVQHVLKDLGLNRPGTADNTDGNDGSSGGGPKPKLPKTPYPTFRKNAPLNPNILVDKPLKLGIRIKSGQLG